MIINNKSLKYRRCPLCNSNIDLNNNDILFINKDDNNLERYIISQCQECNLIHQNPSYSEDYYNNLYSDLIYDPVAQQKNYNPEHVKRYNSIFSVINNFIKDDTSRVLDFGCYNGSFVKWIDQNNLLPKNITIEGYDIYLKNIEQNSSFFNSYDELVKNSAHKKYDIIIFNHVLEHILNPLKTLTCVIEDLLCNEGLVLIEVPDISLINDYDFSPFHIQHISYFTPQTILKLFSNVGLLTKSLITLDNLKLERDPHSPSLVAVGAKDSNFLSNRNDLVSTVSINKNKFYNEIAKLDKDVSIGIVGCGDALYPTLDILKDFNITALFDNNNKLWGEKINRLVVRPVEEVNICNLDYVLICTLNKHNSEMISNQLSEVVNRDKVITLVGSN
jgi:hypothetical protein